MSRVALYEIAYGRSGDKGSDSNIGVIAYSDAGFQFLRDYLTTNKVKAYFKGLEPREVVRYELPNLGALNFILKGALSGGGSLSLRIDSQGKALGQALLEMMIDIPDEILYKAIKRGEVI